MFQILASFLLAVIKSGFKKVSDSELSMFGFSGALCSLQCAGVSTPHALLRSITHGDTRCCSSEDARQEALGKAGRAHMLPGILTVPSSNSCASIARWSWQEPGGDKADKDEDPEAAPEAFRSCSIYRCSGSFGNV